jgi:hypothetical protein
MADKDTKDTAAKDSTSSATTTGGLRTDTYGKNAPESKADKTEQRTENRADVRAATEMDTAVVTGPQADPRLNQFADLEPGDSKVVATGGELPADEVPGVPVKDEDRDLARERREAGSPEPPVPAKGTDLHATSGGYQVTPAGVSPEELEEHRIEHTRQ